MESDPANSMLTYGARVLKKLTMGILKLQKLKFSLYCNSRSDSDDWKRSTESNYLSFIYLLPIIIKTICSVPESI